MTDRFIQLTCSGAVGDLFQNNLSDLENLTATVFFLMTEMKHLLGLIPFHLSIFIREETLPLSDFK